MSEIKDATSLGEWIAPGQMHNGTHFVLREPALGDIKGKILFIHGIGSYHTCFNHLAQFANDQGYQTLQYDLIGRGFSDRSANSQYGEQEHVQQIVHLIHHVYGNKSTEKFHVIAHSMGGSLGLMGYFPIGLVRNLSCIHGVLRGQLTNLENQKKIWRQEYVRKGEQYKVLEEETVNDLTTMYVNEQDKWIEAFVGCVLAFPMTDISANIRIIASQNDYPINLLWGRKDKSVPYSNKRKWTKLLKPGTCKLSYKSYEDTGHVFFHECLDIVQPDILQFINDSN